MIKMEKWARINYQPGINLGDNNTRATGSERHIALSRAAACEGAVLLKNEQDILPLKKGSRIAIFGKAQIDYVKGGGGSGDVNCRYVRNIYEGLKLKKDKVEIFDKLSLFYENAMRQAYKDGAEAGRTEEPSLPKGLVHDAKKFADTAIITLNRYSREGSDRKGDGSDPYFELSSQEKAMVEVVCENFKRVVVLLNTGQVIDTSWFSDNDSIGAALMIWQGGMEGGLAAADLLVGDENPSGKLADTCAKNICDYPSTKDFHESEDYVKYTEDVFVGYRYFETLPDKKERVTYPFGYGLSYTTFELSKIAACRLTDKIIVSVTVKNTGKRSGKEVVQIYYSAPKGRITKPALELCAFAKTKKLAPGETQTVALGFNIDSMASYDDTGVIQKSAYVLEKGEYKIYAGNCVRNLTELDYRFKAEEDTVTSQLTEYCAPERLGSRLNADGSCFDAEDKKREEKVFVCDYVCKENIPENKEKVHMLIDVANGDASLDEFIEQLTDDEMIALLHGRKSRGVANTDGMGDMPEYGIPAPMTTDGPAGVRINPWTGIYTTAFPVATMLACTWNTELVREIGIAGALETKENNLSVWLTPALNIHRSPLCGRNFEYYSEDPFLSGKMAAAMVRGIQSQGICAAAKHFACNNKETNRKDSDSVVSERALREIYLKGFEICVKEAIPKIIMTSYNIINGVRASENAELIEGILRGEWGYSGLVITDWWNNASAAAEIVAGNDVRMPATSTDDLKEALNSNKITRNQLAVCVKRLLEMILWLE